MDINETFEKAQQCFQQGDLTETERTVMRQANAGLLWTKQFYHYVVKDWLGGDPALTVLHRRLREKGLALVLDFVPNHLAREGRPAGRGAGNGSAGGCE